VKGKLGMALTTRAVLLLIPLQAILRDINNIITPPSADPANMCGNVVIATRDYELATVLPKIISEVTRQAPNLRLSIVSQVGDDLAPLEHHHVDFVLAGTDKTSASLHRHTLFEEKFVCLVAKKYFSAEKKLDLDTYLKMKHCSVTINAFGLGLVDKLLAKNNLRRNIVVRVPHFLAAVYLAADTDLIVTLPRRLGELFAQHQAVRLLEPPLTIPSFPIFLYWHSRNQNNPIHQWLRGIIRHTTLPVASHGE
jgi:DNA-binding transcriptional LysR family regulator